MHNILRDKLGLVKKSTRWEPKLLSEEQKKERVRICMDFVIAIPLLFHVDVGQHHYNGRDHGVPPHNCKQEAVKTVDEEGPAKPCILPWFLHWDNTPVHTAPIVKNWLAALPMHLNSCWQAYSYSGKWRSWLAFTSPRRESIMPGKGLSGILLMKTLLLLSGGGLSNRKSELG